MKFIASISIVLFSVSFLSAQINSDINAPQITFESTVIDFGNIIQGSEAIRTFSFKNTGKSPLTIVSIKGACGCTTFPESWPKNSIDPGSSADFKVKYDTSIRIGMFDKKITVTSNASNNLVEVKIKGSVIPAGIPATSGN